MRTPCSASVTIKIHAEISLLEKLLSIESRASHWSDIRDVRKNHEEWERQLTELWH